MRKREREREREHERARGWEGEPREGSEKEETFLLATHARTNIYV